MQDRSETEANDRTAAIIRSNWQRVRDQVADACAKAGRETSDVTIVGVSKYVSPELAAQLIEAGCKHLGENRPQHLWAAAEFYRTKSDQPNADQPAVAWHMIGHLQRNKIARTIPIIRLLHSLDSLRLAQALSLESKTLELTLPVLVEVNVTEDGAKTGLPATQLTSFFDQVAGLPHLRIQGLMAMSSLAADSSAIQREFEQVRLLRDQIQRQFVGM